MQPQEGTSVSCYTQCRRVDGGVAWGGAKVGDR